MKSKLLILMLFIICLSFKLNAQITFNYTDKIFDYKVVVDSVLSGDSVNFDCVVKSISIFRKANKKIVQTIIVPENYTFFGRLEESKKYVFVLEDVNFDGFNDFRVIQFEPANPNIPYYYWTFNYKKQIFQRDTALEEITSPDIDHKRKVITSFWQAGWCDHGVDTYKYINGKITLIQKYEFACDEKNPELLISTTRKLINGKMKLVQRSVDKIKQEK